MRTDVATRTLLASRIREFLASHATLFAVDGYAARLLLAEAADRLEDHPRPGRDHRFVGPDDGEDAGYSRRCGRPVVYDTIAEAMWPRESGRATQTEDGRWSFSPDLSRGG